LLKVQLPETSVKALSDVISRASNAVPGTTISLRTGKDTLLTCFQNDSAVVTLKTPASIISPGHVTLPRETFLKSTRVLNGEVSITEAKKSLVMTSKFSKFRITMLPVESIPSTDIDTPVTSVDIATIAHCVKLVSFVVPKTVDRPSKTDRLGIGFSLSQNWLKLQAYQDSAIAIAGLPSSGDISAVFPKPALELLLSSIHPTVDIKILDNKFLLSTTDMEIYGGLLSTEVVSLNQMLQQDYKAHLSLTEKQVVRFKEAVSSIITLLPTNKRRVGLFLSPLKLSAYIASDEGSGRIELDGIYTGEDMNLSVLPEYITQPLIYTGSASMDFVGSNLPMRIVTTDAEYLFVTDFAEQS
jgi:DNA polymerase III sliding clamp (beta) subunit (PCNA family)